jgi:hypothetical protein
VSSGKVQLDGIVCRMRRFSTGRDGAVPVHTVSREKVQLQGMYTVVLKHSAPFVTVTCRVAGEHSAEGGRQLGVLPASEASASAVS